MITKTPAFVTSDDKVFRSQEEAQTHELEILLGVTGAEETPVNQITRSAVRHLMTHKDETLAILSTRKPRTPKAKVKTVRAIRAAAVNAQLQDTKQ